jgi:hypothetical protein
MSEMTLQNDEPVDARAVWPNKRALEFLSGAQRLFGEEIAFVRDEAVDRAKTETHLFNEFLSKMAEAHSVKDYVGMYEACSQHQLEFLRRDCDRFFKHARHSFDVASSLLRGGLTH